MENNSYGELLEVEEIYEESLEMVDIAYGDYPEAADTSHGESSEVEDISYAGTSLKWRVCRMGTPRKDISHGGS